MNTFRIMKDIPYLEAIVGPMFSGKSNEINRRLINIDYYNKNRVDLYKDHSKVKYIVLRPSLDTRDDSTRQVPYKDKSNRIVDTNNILFDGIESYDYIILDEAQFFSSDIIDQINLLLSLNKYIIVSGLDKDYRGYPFSEFMKWVLCTADDVTKLSAICSKCGAPSTLAKLVSLDGSIPAGNIIIEDDNHKYIPICRKCMNNESLK